MNLRFPQSLENAMMYTWDESVDEISATGTCRTHGGNSPSTRGNTFNVFHGMLTPPTYRSIKLIAYARTLRMSRFVYKSTTLSYHVYRVARFSLEKLAINALIWKFATLSFSISSHVEHAYEKTEFPKICARA